MTTLSEVENYVWGAFAADCTEPAEGTVANDARVQKKVSGGLQAVRCEGEAMLRARNVPVLASFPTQAWSALCHSLGLYSFHHSFKSCNPGQQFMQYSGYRSTHANLYTLRALQRLVTSIIAWLPLTVLIAVCLHATQQTYGVFTPLSSGAIVSVFMVGILVSYLVAYFLILHHREKKVPFKESKDDMIISTIPWWVMMGMLILTDLLHGRYLGLEIYIGLLFFLSLIVLPCMYILQNEDKLASLNPVGTWLFRRHVATSRGSIIEHLWPDRTDDGWSVHDNIQLFIESSDASAREVLKLGNTYLDFSVRAAALSGAVSVNDRFTNVQLHDPILFTEYKGVTFVLWAPDSFMSGNTFVLEESTLLS